MNYLITGSLGHVSRPLAAKMVRTGHTVRVLSRRAEKTAAIEALGATAVIGNVESLDSLASAFKGADAVFTMIPPNFQTDNWKHYIAHIGDNYADAIKRAGVRHVVNLSSIGAHLREGCGPVSALHFVEESLNSLKDVNVRHIRSGFFHTNFLSDIPLIRHSGIIAANYGKSIALPLIHPDDVANMVSMELKELEFTAKSVRYAVGEELEPDVIAGILGSAIGMAGLRWVDMADDEMLASMLDGGLSPETASNYVEMGRALREGRMTEEYRLHPPAARGKITLKDFAVEFAGAYARQGDQLVPFSGTSRHP